VQVRAADIAWQQVEGEVVVLDLRSSRYLSINGTGALLWHRLIEGADREQLAEDLTARHDVPHERALRDVTEFVDHCVSLGILE
jgi:uncharacterized cysteine cluster protein YcgN (CxxCxxCC family)